MQLNKAPKEIKDKVKALTRQDIDKICKYMLTFSTFDIIQNLNSKSKKIIKFIHANKIKEIDGIAIIQLYDQHIELKYLCSNARGGGSKLLLLVEEYAIKHNKKKIVLDALNTAVGFYKKKGFKQFDKNVPDYLYKDLIGKKGNIEKIKKLI
jgi:N-acetylglutamate synthase-like GNAT family acetyltransferase